MTTFHTVDVDGLNVFYRQAGLYPAWQERLRSTQPKTIIFWGQGDLFFTPEGGEAYLRDLPNATLIRLDSGHFAIEDKLEEITAGIEKFYCSVVAS